MNINNKIYFNVTTSLNLSENFGSI